MQRNRRGLVLFCTLKQALITFLPASSNVKGKSVCPPGLDSLWNCFFIKQLLLLNELSQLSPWHLLLFSCTQRLVCVTQLKTGRQKQCLKSNNQGWVVHQHVQGIGLDCTLHCRLMKGKSIELHFASLQCSVGFFAMVHAVTRYRHLPKVKN